MLWKNISKMMIMFPNDYNFCPTTFLLPEDYKKVIYDRESDKRALYILKPNSSSCGKGIKVLGP